MKTETYKIIEIRNGIVQSSEWKFGAPMFVSDCENEKTGNEIDAVEWVNNSHDGWKSMRDKFYGESTK